MAFAKYPVGGGGSGSGDVQGPASSVNNGVTLFDGTTGKIIKDGGIGTSGQVLRSNGTTPSFGLIDNTNIAATFALVNNTTQTFDGLKTFSTGARFSAASNQIDFGPGPNRITFNVPTPSAGLVYNVPNNVAVSATFAMLEASQTFSGAQTMTGDVFITPTGPASGLWLGAAPNRVVLDPGTRSVTAQWTFPNTGDSTFAALEGTQTFTGTKTFSATNTTFSGANVFITTDGALYLGTAPNRVRLLVNARSAASEWLFPNHGSISTFASLEGTQTFTGTSTINDLRIGNVNGDIIFRSGVNQLTLRGGSSAAARTYSVPDVGATASFIMTTSGTTTQTIGGTGLTLNPTTLTLPATVTYASAGSIQKSGVGALVLNASAGATVTFPTGIYTVANLGLGNVLTAEQEFNARTRWSGGAAADLSIWAASNVLRQRGGTSGWAVDNTSGNAILSATDAGAVTLNQIHNIGAGNVTSGRYTPTVTEGTNLTSGNKGTPQSAHYLRVGNTVTVSVRIITLTPTAGAPTNTELYLSLPISSNFTSDTDCAGNLTVIRQSATISNVAGIVIADATNDRAHLIWMANSTGATSVHVTFQYEVK